MSVERCTRCKKPRGLASFIVDGEGPLCAECVILVSGVKEKLRETTSAVRRWFGKITGKDRGEEA